MKIATKLTLFATLSLLVGIAVAAPLLASELNIIPYPRVAQGPKADISVDTVYANYAVQENAIDLSQSSVPDIRSIVHYNTVLNVTNNSNRSATIQSMDFLTADDVSVVDSIAGGMSSSSGLTHTNGGGQAFLDGVWLDNQWLNVTWLPNGQWPMFPNDPSANITKIIPPLPADAQTNGTWIEGVHVCENLAITKTDSGVNVTSATQHVFVNGTWVDVTGRVRMDHKQPYVIATDTMINHMLCFETEKMGHYANQAEFNTAHPQVDENKLYPQRFIWSGDDGFNNTWQPGESKLIQLRGTWYVDDIGLLKAGKITLYAAVSSYFEDLEAVRVQYSNTFSTITNVKHVDVTKTETGYLYNTALDGNETFQLDQFGVQAFIEPRS
jgi:hypothetical protein